MAHIDWSNPQISRTMIHSLRCTACGFETIDKDRFDRHAAGQLLPNGERHPDNYCLYECSVCAARSTSKRLISEHGQMYHGDQGRSFNVLEHTEKYFTPVKESMLTNQDSGVTCLLCKTQISGGPSAYANHLAQVHLLPLPVIPSNNSPEVPEKACLPPSNLNGSNGPSNGLTRSTTNSSASPDETNLKSNISVNTLGSDSSSSSTSSSMCSPSSSGRVPVASKIDQNGALNNNQAQLPSTNFLDKFSSEFKKYLPYLNKIPTLEGMLSPDVENKLGPKLPLGVQPSNFNFKIFEKAFQQNLAGNDVAQKPPKVVDKQPPPPMFNPRMLNFQRILQTQLMKEEPLNVLGNPAKLGCLPPAPSFPGMNLMQNIPIGTPSPQQVGKNTIDQLLAMWQKQQHQHSSTATTIPEGLLPPMTPDPILMQKAKNLLQQQNPNGNHGSNSSLQMPGLSPSQPECKRKRFDLNQTSMSTSNVNSDELLHFKDVPIGPPKMTPFNFGGSMEEQNRSPSPLRAPLDGEDFSNTKRATNVNHTNNGNSSSSHNAVHNTLRKTKSDMKVIQRYLLQVKDDAREIQDIPPEELDKYVQDFIVTAKKKDGHEYEPESLKAFVHSLERHLKYNNYPYSVLKDNVFQGTRNILNQRLLELRALSRTAAHGNPAAASSSGCNLDMSQNAQIAQSLANSRTDLPDASPAVHKPPTGAALLRDGLLGVDNPQAILNSLWLMNRTQFNVGGTQRHRSLLWGQFQLVLGPDSAGVIQFTATGDTNEVRFCRGHGGSGNNTAMSSTHATNSLSRVLAAQHQPISCTGTGKRLPMPFHCVDLFELYARLRPVECRGPNEPFYLCPDPNWARGGAWFKPTGCGAQLISRIPRMLGLKTTREPLPATPSQINTNQLGDNTKPLNSFQLAAAAALMSNPQPSTAAPNSNEEQHATPSHFNAFSNFLPNMDKNFDLLEQGKFLKELINQHASLGAAAGIMSEKNEKLVNPNVSTGPLSGSSNSSRPVSREGYFNEDAETPESGSEKLMKLEQFEADNHQSTIRMETACIKQESNQDNEEGKANIPLSINASV